MRRILLDEDLDAELSRNGFVKVPFLEPNEARELRSIVVPLSEETKKRSAIRRSPSESFWSMDVELKRRIFDELTTFLVPMVDRIVDGFLPLAMSIVEKEPGSGEVEMHQHWTFVDENRFESITIHVPLVDTTRRNGTLELVRGSHKVFSKYRGPRIPSPFQGIVRALKEDYSEPVDLMRGEAVVFFDSMLHYSRDNHSPDSRIACNFNLHPREAKPIVYRWDPGVPNRLAVFAIDSDFLCRYGDASSFERLPSLGTIPYRRLEPMGEVEFAERIAQSNPVIRAKPAR